MRVCAPQVKETLKIPVLGLVDSDPYGLKVRDSWLCSDLLAR